MKKNKDVRNYYVLGQSLGESNFGIVYTAEKKESNEKRAIKIIDKNMIRNAYKNTRFIEPDDGEMKNYINCFFNEIRKMETSEGKNKDNENTVKFDECFENENELAIVMELCDDNMLNYLSKKKSKLAFQEINEIIKQLNKTFRIMADNNMIYGDLKLENILLKYTNSEKTKYTIKLKVAYFSDLLTKLRETVSSMSKSYFSNCLSAPELLKGENTYTEKIDLWSLGAIIYVLTFKEYPYKGITKTIILDNIKKNIIKKIENPDLNDLVRHLLIEDPQARYGWSQYFAHPFFKNKHNINFRNNYEIINRIGQAKHADIFKVKEKKTNEYRAIKVFDKKGIKRKLRESLSIGNKEEEEKKYFNRFHNEIKNMEMICKNENKNIVKFYEYYDTEEELASVMELCDNNLLDFFVHQKRPLNYDEIYEILTQLNNSFQIITQLKIVHRALNLENILIKYENDEKTKYTVKLKFTDDSILISEISNNYEAKGNMNFIAPEILKKEEYNENSDLWSIGVILYVLSFKDYPYLSNDKAKLLKNIKEKKLNNIKNDELGDLIKKLLIEDPKKRLNWSQYFNHSFFRHKDYKEFRNYYEIEKSIGNIEYANVYKARDKKSNELRAIKVFDINKIKSKIRKSKLHEPSEKDLEPYIQGFFNEINHMKMLSEKGNQNTVKYYEYFEYENEFVIVMELCDDNLLTFFTNKEKYFNYKRIYNILSQLNNSFRIMAKKKLVHRDLNLENILIKYENDENREYIVKLKLTDDSGLLDDLIKHQTFKIKGNILYIAPEILKKEKYDEKCDLWSLGVIIYALAFKIHPYQGNNGKEILDKIKNTTLKKIDNENLDDLIRKLLVEDPKKRLNWEQYFNHPFFTGRENENYKIYYSIEDIIGNAKNAVVYKVKEKISQVYRAIKVFDKNKAISEFKKNYLRDPDEEEMKYIADTFSNEIKYMRIISEDNNQNIVKFYENFESKDELAIVMELCDDNLLNLFIKRKSEKKTFTTEEISDILSQLNNSFKIMNKHGIIHRALNLENILIKYKNEQKINYIVKLKLTDDSCSLDDLSNLPNLKVSENTNYIAPEIFRGQKYNEECDLWSLGVIIYILTFGNYPFKGDYESEILNEIKKNRLEKAENADLDDLIKNLLIENPQKRMNWKQYFSHRFFK